MNNFTNEFKPFIGKNQKPAVAPWRLKNTHVPFDKLNPNLLTYLDSLPIELQNSVYVTSDIGDTHAKHSRHYSGNALDLRIANKSKPYEDPLFAYFGTDKNRKDKKIVVLDPNHGGTAPHIHLSYGEGSENEYDYFYGKNSILNKGVSEGVIEGVNEVATGGAIEGVNSLPIPQMDNSPLLQDLRKLVEENKFQEEAEKGNEELMNSRAILQQRQQDRNNQLEFIKNFKLEYKNVDYSNPELEDGGTIDFVRSQGVKPMTNFEQRIYNPTSYIEGPEGKMTHKMMSWESDGKFYAAPTIVEIDGILTELNEDEAIDYAFKNNEYKEFSSDIEAQAYASNGYKLNTPLEKF